jgi:hypothetical protein
MSVEKFVLAVAARFKAFKKRVPSSSYVGKRPQRASASRAKPSVPSELSGLENVANVLFNDFIDDVFEPEDESEQRASASLPEGGYPAGRDRWGGMHGKRAAGGMSEDHDRCFSTLVLGAFSTGVFQHQCSTPH